MLTRRCKKVEKSGLQHTTNRNKIMRPIFRSTVNYWKGSLFEGPDCALHGARKGLQPHSRGCARASNRGFWGEGGLAPPPPSGASAITVGVSGLKGLLGHQFLSARQYLKPNEANGIPKPSVVGDPEQFRPRCGQIHGIVEATGRKAERKEVDRRGISGGGPRYSIKV
jgi:hypothetical protein